MLDAVSIVSFVLLLPVILFLLLLDGVALINGYVCPMMAHCHQYLFDVALFGGTGRAWFLVLFK
jgi:hypothetical protein